MQSYPCNINIFLGRKVPGRKIFPGGFGSPNAGLLSLSPS